MVSTQSPMESLQALHGAIVHSSGSVIIVGNLDGVIILFNHAAEELLGYSAEEVVGNNRGQTPFDSFTA